MFSFINASFAYEVAFLSDIDNKINSFLFKDKSEYNKSLKLYEDWYLNFALDSLSKINCNKNSNFCADIKYNEWRIIYDLSKKLKWEQKIEKLKESLEKFEESKKLRQKWDTATEQNIEIIKLLLKEEENKKEKEEQKSEENWKKQENQEQNNSDSWENKDWEWNKKSEEKQNESNEEWNKNQEKNETWENWDKWNENNNDWKWENTTPLRQEFGKSYSWEENKKKLLSEIEKQNIKEKAEELKKEESQLQDFFRKEREANPSPYNQKFYELFWNDFGQKFESWEKKDW